MRRAKPSPGSWITPLAQPILHLERERDQWRRLLEERARAYAEVAWRDKWGALLPIGAQVQLLAARARGRFRYGKHRAYALRSLARGFPIMATAALLVTGAWAAREYEAGAQIEAQLAKISGNISDDSAAGLADLATSSFITRWRVTHDIFSLPTHADWFASNPEPILRALVRLDPGRFDAMIQTYVTPATLQQTDRDSDRLSIVW
jgi:hypothetical protein